MEFLDTEKKNNEVIKVEIIRHEIIYEGKRAKLVLVNDVTEKLKIEEEIKIVSKSALDFKNAVFSASIISIADKKGLITFVNKNFIDISGFSEIELIGKNHRIINSGVHSKEFWQDMWQTILSGKTWRNEVKNRAKDGTYYWVDTFIIPFIDDDGEITQLLSIRNDITEKKNSELELILNKKAVESALEGIVITDASLPDNPIIYSNERFTIITGYSKEDVYGKNCRFLQGAETDPELIKKIKNAVKSKEDFEVEILNYKKDGTKFWNYLRISRIQNNEGVVTHFAGFQNDITQRKLAELMLIEREKSFQDIFNFSPVPLVISSIEEREILMVNDSFSNLLGIEANNLIGENTFHFFSKDFDRTNLLIELEKNGEFLNLEFKIILENNEEIDCLISITKIKINNNLVYLTSIIDIRKIKETENSLIEAKEYAEEMSRLKSTFLANMSHELRTPMNGILGFSELMKDIDDVEEIKEISEFIHSSAKRLTDTLNLILDISSIESGILNIVYSEVDLVEVIKENIKLFSQLALKKGLYLKYTSDIDKLIVYSNSQVLNSILNNLINNAIKFTNEGGVTIELDFINDNENEKFDTKGYIIRVIDTGIGIDEKDFELIFSAFRQVSEGISRSYEGSGLGLTLTRKYLEVMNGNISVESELGKGTTFIVKLPFEQQID